jgi:hypothetical protein
MFRHCNDGTLKQTTVWIMLSAMTSQNIKTARFLTKQSRETLCMEAKIPFSTWSRLESYGPLIPRVSVDTLMRAETIFLKYGLAFMPSGVVSIAEGETAA